MDDSLISRAVAINELGDLMTLCRESMPNENGEHYVTEKELCIFYMRLANIPAVDAVPVVHARWSKARFEKTYAGYTKASIYYVCSACGKDVDDALFNYCPKCGAKMDGERRDSE